MAKDQFGQQDGTQILRVYRILRLFRLVRISRLWKASNMLINRKVNKYKQEEDALNFHLQQQRTIDLMKQQKQIAANMQDLANIDKRAKS